MYNKIEYYGNICVLFNGSLTVGKLKGRNNVSSLRKFSHFIRSALDSIQNISSCLGIIIIHSAGFIIIFGISIPYIYT